MSDRLISADKLKAHYAWWKGGTRELTMDEAKHDFDTIIDLQPTVEPKRGRWLPSDKGDCTYICSECGFVRDAYILEEKAYCPRCGADMREVKE